MASLQVNALFSPASGLGAPQAASGRAVTAVREQSIAGQDAAVPQASGARPGPPVSRLSFDTQNQAQDASGDVAAEVETDNRTGEATQETNENGEAVNEEGLTEAEEREVEKLKARDREVRAHERAHATAGGGIAGQPQFTFQQGPDGKQYAVGGEVSIDTSPVSGNPEATIRKMEIVKRAALAPSNPSGQDRRVAAEAEAKIQTARREIQEEKREEAAEAAEKREANRSGETNAIGQSDPVFNPEGRFNRPVGSGSPLGTGLAGQGDLNMDTGTLSAGELFNLVA